MSTINHRLARRVFAFISSVIAAAGLIAVRPVLAASSSPLTLWYQQPAGSGMNEALPIGNGRMGGLVYGGTSQEQIVFNEDSLWTGDKNPSGDYGSMGSYQKFGEIDIHLPGHDVTSGYRRDLDLSTATAHVRYRVGATTYTREYFASHPAQVLVAHLGADRPGAYTGTISLVGAHSEKTSASGRLLMFSGTLPNGIAYEAELQVTADGGTVAAHGDAISLDRCNGVTLILGTGTSYVMDFAKNYLGDNPHARVTRQVDAASATPYAQLRSRHIADYAALFGRVSLSLGSAPADRRALPTDARKILAAQGDDPEMEALLYQYGRYLLISCSRPGSLPANLQGLWCDSNTPPWDSDYHTDVNIEMNYWPSDVSGLSECELPLFDLIESQITSWRTLTQAAPEYKLASGAQPSTGWDVRASFNITGGMGWLWIKTCDAWMARQYWEHYAFTGDRRFLRDRAYPVLMELSKFWAEQLKTLPSGQLVVPNGWSPEHGPFEDGTSFNQEVVYDLFTNYIDASKALGVDADYRAEVASLRDKLYVPKIGKYGQLEEWMEDKDDPTEHHRHTSHLYGVYPGHQFTPDGTPALLRAAKIALFERGNTGDVTEWALVWRTALFARMLDGENAHRQLMQFFAEHNSCVNLFGFCPPMQIDGDFGATAAISEMLLQSQNGEIDLLPAIPAAWRTGYVRGLRARGGFIVDENWSHGLLISATIRSVTGASCKLRYKNVIKTIEVKPGRAVVLRGTSLAS